jgi:hypothetical protein
MPSFTQAIAISGLLLSVLTSACASVGYVSKTSTEVSIAPQNAVLVATTITNWDPKASDDLIVEWQAPKGFCKSSSFSLVPGNATLHDVSSSYRTVSHTMANGLIINCSGKWVVNVVNHSTGAKLASAGYFVPPAAEKATS